ncbi:MAG: hypothetical protein GXP13_03025 [Gammaproteobacteria bacterium]|nr:hypothetical protein [Gammaproteobacteria bacterium]
MFDAVRGRLKDGSPVDMLLAYARELRALVKQDRLDMDEASISLSRSWGQKKQSLTYGL